MVCAGVAVEGVRVRGRLLYVLGRRLDGSRPMRGEAKVVMGEWSGNRRGCNDLRGYMFAWGRSRHCVSD